MRALLILCLFLLPGLVKAQGRKDIRDNGIKKCSVYNITIVDGKEVKKLETVTKYNADGREVEQTKYDKKTGKVEVIEIYEYDANGNKSKVIEKDASGKIVKISVYKYNDKDFRTEKQILDGNGKMKSRDVYTYEKNAKSEVVKESE
jgi:hypothetical protein